MRMDRIFQILAIFLAGIAAYFLWEADNEKAFLSGVLAAVSFLLSIRFQIKGRMDQRRAEPPDTGDSE